MFYSSENHISDTIHHTSFYDLEFLSHISLILLSNNFKMLWEEFSVYYENVPLAEFTWWNLR